MLAIALAAATLVSASNQNANTDFRLVKTDESTASVVDIISIQKLGGGTRQVTIYSALKIPVPLYKKQGFGVYSAWVYDLNCQNGTASFKSAIVYDAKFVQVDKISPSIQQWGTPEADFSLPAYCADSPESRSTWSKIGAGDWKSAIEEARGLLLQNSRR